MPMCLSLRHLRYAQDKLGMGTEFTAEDFGDDFPSRQSEVERHVSGQELCEAMRLYAHEQYGYLAKSVLNHWGVNSTGDFGEIVFNSDRYRTDAKDSSRST